MTDAENEPVTDPISPATPPQGSGDGAAIADDAEADGGAGADGGGRPRWAMPVALVAVAVLAVGAIGFGLAQRSRVSDLESAADRRAEIATVAGEFATALLTYDYQDLDQSSSAIQALSTPDFSSEYTAAFEAGLGAEILELEATATGTVHDVFISDSDADTARVIVVADSEIVSAAGNRAALGTYLDVQLLRLDGTWRVDDVTTVANTDQSGVPAPEDQPIPPQASTTTPGTPATSAPDATATTTPGG